MQVRCISPYITTVKGKSTELLSEGDILELRNGVFKLIESAGKLVPTEKQINILIEAVKKNLGEIFTLVSCDCTYTFYQEYNKCLSVIIYAADGTPIDSYDIVINNSTSEVEYSEIVIEYLENTIYAGSKQL